MKYLINIIIFVLLLVIGGGCSSFLNETPTANLSTSNYYQTASDAQRALKAVYHQMALIGVYTSYTKPAFGDIMSDNAAKGGGGISDQAQIENLKRFVAKPSNGTVEGAWQNNYRGIYLTSVVLSKIPNIDMNAQQKAKILAQAHFLRSYFYLQLVRLFGNIPLIQKPLKEGDYNQPQVKPNKIWSFIKQDVDSAMANLPTQNELSAGSLGQVTKGAAQSLLLNVDMWQKKWNQAEKLGDQIINSSQYSLAPNYFNIWTKNGEFGPGSIFEINFSDIPGKGTGNPIPGQEASRATWGLEFDCPTQNLVDAFEDGDPRLKATVIFENEQLPEGVTSAKDLHSPTGYDSRKYWLPPSQRPYNNGGGGGLTNERVYRLAEIMLWDAEASVHNGDIAHATQLVNKVRARARNSGDNINSSTLPPYSEVTLQEVYHEERVEQAMGAHRRFYNLVRTGRAANILSGYKEGVNNHIPIPLNEIQLSDGVLKQNPGY